MVSILTQPQMEKLSAANSFAAEKKIRKSFYELFHRQSCVVKTLHAAPDIVQETQIIAENTRFVTSGTSFRDTGARDGNRFENEVNASRN